MTWVPSCGRSLASWWAFRTQRAQLVVARPQRGMSLRGAAGYCPGLLIGSYAALLPAL